MVRKENTVAVEHLGGGKGTAYVHHIISKEEFLGHGRMYAKVVLPPGASVGWHQHVHDTEPYYILKGQVCHQSWPWRLLHHSGRTVPQPGEQLQRGRGIHGTYL